MLLLFSLSPIVVTIAGLLLRLRSVYAALLGVLTAVAVSIGYFPIQDWSGTSTWLVVMVEVLLIVGGGLLLAQALHTSGAQEQLSHWVHQRTGSGVKGVLLVVHGVVPFAESLTGFGIGITIGIPLLLHMGLEKRKVAAIGLLGLCAIPWGSMGPGTLVAAKMSGLSFDALGLASAVFNVVPFVLTGMAAAYIASESGHKSPSCFNGCGFGLGVGGTGFRGQPLFWHGSRGCFGGTHHGVGLCVYRPPF
jgi:lactate permease